MLDHISFRKYDFNNKPLQMTSTSGAGANTADEKFRFSS
jgi:hypothetical protein